MKERELLQQLNKLREIKLDESWKKNQRDLLLTQISNSAPKELSAWSNFVIVFRNSVKTFSQPAVAFASFVCLMFGAAVFSHNWLNSAKPTDTMYVARVISEKVKLNTVIDKEAREKMEVQFAACHATDIITALADPEFNTTANEVKVAKLNENFNKEINTVKSRLSSLNEAAEKAVVASAVVEQMVTTASSEKSDEGIDLFIPKTKSLLPATATLVTSTSSASTTSTTTPEGAELSIPALKLNKGVEFADQVKTSVEKKDYNKALLNLEAINELIK